MAKATKRKTITKPRNQLNFNNFGEHFDLTKPVFADSAGNIRSQFQINADGSARYNKKGQLVESKNVTMVYDPNLQTKDSSQFAVANQPDWYKNQGKSLWQRMNEWGQRTGEKINNGVEKMGGWGTAGNLALGTAGLIANTMLGTEQVKLAKQAQAAENKQREIENERYERQWQRQTKAEDDIASTATNFNQNPQYERSGKTIQEANANAQANANQNNAQEPLEQEQKELDDVPMKRE